MSEQKKERIVIIGGGVSGMTTAYALSDPGMQGRYDITVYQMGWRLGGKGASGRNASRHQRIEEHGLHIWFGFYDNAFTVMRRCYEELAREAGTPLATVDDAFSVQDYFILQEKTPEGWTSWHIDFPSNDEEPGGHPSPVAFLEIIVRWIRDAVHGMPNLHGEIEHDEIRAHAERHGILKDVEGLLEKTLAGTAHSVLRLARALHEHVKNLPEGPITAIAGKIAVFFIDLLANHTWQRLKDRVDSNDDARRQWILMAMGMTCVRGMIIDDIPGHGFNVIDRYDFREWMQARSPLKDGPDKEKGDQLAYWSPPLQAFYDAAFCYEDGDVKKPRIGAGIGLLAVLRILFSYKGSIVYTMRAGMGDTIFAPLYLVLLARGVKFEFFHRVDNLRLSSDHKEIAAIEITRQVELKRRHYAPLVNVRDLPCWPSEPLWDQIVDGETIRASGVNLEHYRSQPQPSAGQLLLRAGEDFDRVVLGVPLDCLPYVAAELIEHSERWQRMNSEMKSVQTQAMQIWCSLTRQEMGLPGPPAVIGSYVEPWSSITDFSHLIPREDWPVDMNVNFLTYTCGVLLHQPEEHQQSEDAKVRERAVRFLDQDVQPIWQRACSLRNPAGIDWSVLVAPDGDEGPARFDSQYWRANIDPTEMYVLSLPGTMQYRLRAGDNDYRNLVVCGTWTDAGFNIGSVECAVMSGLQAARHISGQPIEIIGSDW